MALALAAGMNVPCAADAPIEPRRGPSDWARVVADARALMSEGRLAPAESLAAAVLRARRMTAREDSLGHADLLGILVQARLRQGRAPDPSVAAEAGRLAAMLDRLYDGPHPAKANAEGYLAFIASARGEWLAAIDHHRAAVALLRRSVGAGHPAVADALNNLAATLVASGRAAEARGSLTEAIHIQERAALEGDPALAASRLNLARATIATGDTAGVRALFREACAALDRPGADPARAAEALVAWGRWESLQGGAVPGAALLDRGIGLLERAARPGLLAEALTARARIELAAGDLRAARSTGERAAGLRVPAGAPQAFREEETELLLGDVDTAEGRYESAVGRYRLALEAARGADPVDSTRITTCLQALGAALLATGRGTEASEAFSRAIAIAERTHGPDDPQAALAHAGRAAVFRAASQVDSARAESDLAIGILERSVGADDLRLSGPLLGRAGLARDLGEYDEALRRVARAVRIRRNRQGAGHVDVAEGLHEMGITLGRLGRPAEAADTLRLARDILERGAGPERPGLAAILNSLALVERARGDTTAARSDFEKALSILRSVFPAGHPLMALPLNNLGSLANSAGEYAAARRYFEQALAVRGLDAGRDEPASAGALVGMGNAFKGEGRLAAAAALYRRAARIRIAALGSEAPGVALALHNLAGTLLEAGHAQAALDTALISEAISREGFRLVTQGLSESEALRYLGVRVSGLDIAMSAASRLGDETACRAAWDGVIHSRALVLDEMTERRRAVAEAAAADDRVKQRIRDLAKTSNRLANLVVAGRAAEPGQRLADALRAARVENENAERALAEASASFRARVARRRVGLEETLRALPADAAMVAFCRFTLLERPAGRQTTPRSDAGLPHYGAFVVRSGSEPRFVRLGAAGRIDTLVGRWQTEASRRPVGGAAPDAEAVYRREATALRMAVWDPIRSVVSTARVVHVIPDGALTLVNFATLPDGEGYLLETGPQIRLLSAERDLATPARVEGRGGGMLTMANPGFDAATVEPAAADRSRSRGSACADFERLWFAPLPATAAEQDDVVALWSRTGASRRSAQLATRLSGAEASEANFKREAPGRRVIHLATHGFFLDDNCARHAGASALPDLSEGVEQAVAEHPLLLSGLALAGANQREETGEDGNDGILTAHEISAIDLTGVDLAILSACKTGLGRMQAGEGVLGLRRAFATAGARSLVMSLWAVDDRATARWVVTFLEACWMRELDAAEAARRASLAVLAEQRKQGSAGHPFYWGPFVVADGHD